MKVSPRYTEMTRNTIVAQTASSQLMKSNSGGMAMHTASNRKLEAMMMAVLYR